MRCRFEEVIDMVLVKVFQNLADADTFVKEHAAANEKFVVGCSNGRPAVYCQVRRRVYR